MQNSRARPIIPVIILTVLAWLGNLWNLPLFFGVDFLFGSIAVMMIISLYGARWGTAAAAVAASYTYVLWNHPYAIIVFSCEALFVGLLLERRRWSIILLDTLYWMFLGMPMVWFFHYVVLKMDTSATVLIVLKQGVNGIFNSTIACLALSLMQLLPFKHGRAASSPIRLKDVLFNATVTLVLLAALTTLAINSRIEYNRIVTEVADELGRTKINLLGIMTRWQARNAFSVRALADVGAASELQPSASLQKNTETVAKLSPQFHLMCLADSGGTTVAAYPPVNKRGEPTVGANFSDRQYFKDMSRTLQPALSDVFTGRAGVSVRIVTFSVPIIKEGRFAGYAIGAINLDYISERLAEAGSHSLHATLVDNHNRVVSSTRSDLKPSAGFDTYRNGQMTSLTSDVLQWTPPVGRNVPVIERWVSTLFVSRALVGAGLQWELFVEESALPSRNLLYGFYARALGVVLAVMLLSIALTEFVSRSISRPLSYFSAITRDVPGKIARREKIEWTGSSVEEIQDLMTNFKQMAASLEEQLAEVNEAKNALQSEVDARTKELQLALVEMERSESFVRHILDSVDESFLVVDAQYQVIEANRAFCRQIGASREQILGDHCYHVTHRLDRPCCEVGEECPTRHTLETGLPHSTRHVHGERTVEIRAFPQVDGSGKVISVIETMTDITDKLRMEEQIFSAQKLESLGILAGGIAHDFNNLLASIIGGVSFAKMLTPPGGQIHGILAQSEEACKRASNLSYRLLTFSKGGVPVRRLTTIQHLLTDTVPLSLSGSNVQLVMILSDDLPAVLIDERQMRQVFSNLSINAKEAMPRGGRLRVVAEQVSLVQDQGIDLHSGPHLKILFEDEGKGIAPEIISKIFDPYFTTKGLGTNKGQGLGLTICHSIVQKHGGAITAESLPGGGARFAIYLPIAPSAPRPLLEADKEVGLPTASPMRILVMDDEERIREMLTSLLGHFGHDVQTVPDSRSAVEAYQSAIGAGQPFDAVILDLTIQGGPGGIETIAELQKIDSRVRAIVSSGYVDDPAIRNFRDYGFSGAISKPYTAETLKKTLESL